MSWDDSLLWYALGHSMRPNPQPRIEFDKLPLEVQQSLLQRYPEIQATVGPTGRRAPTIPLASWPSLKTTIPDDYVEFEFDYAELERKVAKQMQRSDNILRIPILLLMAFGQVLMLPGKAVCWVGNQLHKLLTGYELEDF